MNNNCFSSCALKDSQEGESNHCRSQQLIACGLESEFKQVILNLVSNAEYALIERKIPDKCIRIHVLAEIDTITIIISDNAGGIPHDVIDRIFEPYFTTKGEKGTGIGLYMSKMIIENNNGGSLCVNNNHQGAEFTITLPR